MELLIYNLLLIQQNPKSPSQVLIMFRVLSTFDKAVVTCAILACKCKNCSTVQELQAEQTCWKILIDSQKSSLESKIIACKNCTCNHSLRKCCSDPCVCVCVTRRKTYAQNWSCKLLHKHAFLYQSTVLSALQSCLIFSLPHFFLYKWLLSI